MDLYTHIMISDARVRDSRWESGSSRFEKRAV
jgi:hypothetical protein